MLKVQHFIDQTMHACSRPLGGWTKTLISTMTPSSPTLPGRRTLLDPRKHSWLVSKNSVSGKTQDYEVALCPCWDHSDNFSVEKSLKIFLHQPGPSCDCPSLRAPWGMCRRVYGLRRGPRVSQIWRTAVTYISTFNRHSLFTLYWTIKTHFDPLKYFIIRCASTFSDEEQDSLKDTAEKIASYECFLHLFEQVNQSLLVFEYRLRTPQWGAIHPFHSTVFSVNDVST